MNHLKAPFPYFGGKSTVADIIWAALGSPKHYIEPFAGSCAILLNRPNYDPTKHMETINDADGYVCNVWRALQFNPDAVAKYCDWPVNHADLNARRNYLLKNSGVLENLSKDPEWYNSKLAGYWVWAACCWIGSGLTRPRSMPEITNDKGINKRSIYSKRPHLGNEGEGINQRVCQIPLLNHETGVCRRPCFGSEGAYGVHKTTIVPEPDLNLDVRDPYTPELYTWFRQLSERLRRVRIVCGDWSQVCGGDWQDGRGNCGMAFDPPYGEKAQRCKDIYHQDSFSIADEVRNWCLERGERKTYRIVLCGYYEEHESLLNEGWTVKRWKAHGGFANKAKDKTKCRGETNRHREAIFFSPHCLTGGLEKFMDLGMIEEWRSK